MISPNWKNPTWAAIYDFLDSTKKTWMAGTSPAMTAPGWVFLSHLQPFSLNRTLLPCEEVKIDPRSKCDCSATRGQVTLRKWSTFLHQAAD
jgi:hypothetical protein